MDYRLKLHCVPLRWQSRITGWVPDKRFSDLQTRGPYTFWHHIHEFYESKGGTVIRDNVAYKIPGWVPGDILADLYVKKYLEKNLSLEDSKSKNSLFKILNPAADEFPISTEQRAQNIVYQRVVHPAHSNRPLV